MNGVSPAVYNEIKIEWLSQRVTPKEKDSKAFIVLSHVHPMSVIEVPYFDLDKPHTNMLRIAFDTFEETIATMYGDNEVTMTYHSSQLGKTSVRVTLDKDKDRFISLLSK